jgi:hypothetical protein
MIYDTMLDYIRRELREVAAESRYKTAKGAGLRSECVKSLEEGKGTVDSFAAYIEYVCRTRPHFAYKLFYSLSMIVCQEYGRKEEGV